MKSPQDTYRCFIEFEERAAAIYLRLASHFSAKSLALSAMWLDMAMQEKQHGGLLQFCLAEEFFAAKLPNEAQIRKFVRLFKALEKRAAAPTLDVSQAFELAWELEGSEVNAIYDYLTTPTHRSQYLFRRKIVLSPSDHIERLAAAAKKFGAAPATLKKLERLKASCANAFF